MKWKEWGFMPPLCTCRLIWARRTAWGWWYNTAPQTQDSQFDPWRSEAEHATCRLRRLLTILNLHEWAGKKHFVSLKFEGRSGDRSPTVQAAVLTTSPGPYSHTRCWWWPTLVYCWPTVYDVGPAVNQRWVNVLCLLGRRTANIAPELD